MKILPRSLRRLGAGARRLFRRTPRSLGERGIDVVVPVHDARDDVQRCIASVLWNGTGDFRLVVVDDASSDATLAARLQHLAARDPRVVLLRNELNLGFVKSSNRGLRYGTQRDVLLLNSDTEVPAGFLERLRAAVAHTPRTGIVSPLTNDGTILSVPEFMVANPLPAGLDVAGFDRLIAATSARTRPEIVTAHGFCMLIRREVLDAVGYFDEAFGRGYGEENDLCQRAKAAGFEIRACDDLFVWHRGSASFAAETTALRSANLELLGRRHPRYHDDVQRFIRANPLSELHEAICYQLARRAPRRAPALLMILHADPFADPRHEPVGGTQMHVLDLVRALALPRVVVAWPEGNALHAAEVAGGDVGHPVKHSLPLPSGDGRATPDRFALADPGRERAFEALIDLFDVGAAHLHHLSGWPARIWRTLATRGIPFAYTVHDYLCTCPAFYRLDLASGAACACIEGPSGDAERCLRAFFSACGLALPDDPLARVHAQRAEFGALLAAADAVLAPSDAARGVVARAFPQHELRWQVIPHALPVAATPAGTSAADDRVLRVGLLGAPSAPWKGADAVLAAMRATQGVEVEWHVFGDAGAYGFPERAAAALGVLATERLHLHGRYVRDEVVSLLARAHVDVTLIPSPWPETFSYTLSESWAAGVPAIVLDLGAPAARVRATGAGIVARDVPEMVRALRDLANDPVRRRALADAAVAAARNEPTLADNADAHRRAYGAMLDRVAARSSDPPYGEADRQLFTAYRAAARERATASDASADAGYAVPSENR